MWSQVAVRTCGLLACVASALLVRMLIEPIYPQALLAATFFPAVAAPAIFWGWRYGAAALTLSLLAVWFLQFHVSDSPAVDTQTQHANLVIFFLVGAMLVWLGGRTFALGRSSTASAESWRQLVERLPVPVVVRAQDGRFIVVSDGWVERTGYSRGELQTLKDWVRLAYPQAPQEVEARIVGHGAVASIAPGDKTSLPYKLKTADGKVLIWEFIGLPMSGLLDKDPHMMTVAIDRTEQEEREQQFQLVVRELNHRLRNMITVVQSTVIQVLRNTDDNKLASARIADQLGALVKAYDLIMKREAAVTLLDLVKLEADAHGKEDRIQIVCPDLQVSSQAALPLALILHEITTNCVKYGAWSNEAGHVRVTVTRDFASGQVLVRWDELGGPRPAASERTGFGTHLITRATRALGGKAEISPLETGFCYAIGLPESSLNPKAILKAQPPPRKLTPHAGEAIA
ncbi:MAG: hypothetical protein JWN93_654 [Hyphomicrobiales bacterium]|nr:hypothetical protein [Hyphomicrobiales bacterium]